MLVAADPPSGRKLISLRQGEMWNGLPLRGFRASRHTKTGPSRSGLDRDFQPERLGNLHHRGERRVSLPGQRLV
jgi:hypothetical protein